MRPFLKVRKQKLVWHAQLADCMDSTASTSLTRRLRTNLFETNRCNEFARVALSAFPRGTRTAPCSSGCSDDLFQCCRWFDQASLLAARALTVGSSSTIGILARPCLRWLEDVVSAPSEMSLLPRVYRITLRRHLVSEQISAPLDTECS